MEIHKKHWRNYLLATLTHRYGILKNKVLAYISKTTGKLFRLKNIFIQNENLMQK